MAQLPEYVRQCGMCDGKGSYVQTYTAGCGMGYFSMKGRCDWCEGTGYRWNEETSGREGVPPQSVLNQIKDLPNA